MSDAPTAPADSGAADAPPRRARRPGPNYAARRMLVTTVGITAVVAFAVVGWMAVRDDDDSSGGQGGDWDEIALVDRATGAITRIDDEGAFVGASVGLGRVTDVYVHGDHLALVGVDQLAVYTDDDEPVVVPIERNSTVTPIETSDTLHLAVGRATGGNVLIVDVETGAVMDVGEMAEQSDPLLFVETLRWSDDAGAFAVADAAFFQTIVVRPGDDDAVFLPDQPVAVGEELVATSQTVGRRADIALLDAEGGRQAVVPTAIPAGGVMTGDSLVMVSVDGDILEIAKGAEEARSLGSVSVPSGSTVRSVHPAADGDRLVVVGPAFAAVIDLEGDTVFSNRFTTPVDVVPPRPGWTCLPVGGDDTYHSLIDLTNGDQLADLSGVVVTGVSGDGCAVIGERAGVSELVTADGTVRLGRARHVSLAPDGRTVVRTSTTGRSELIRIEDDLTLGEPVALERAPSSLAVAFLDR